MKVSYLKCKCGCIQFKKFINSMLLCTECQVLYNKDDLNIKQYQEYHTEDKTCH